MPILSNLVCNLKHLTLNINKYLKAAKTFQEKKEKDDVLMKMPSHRSSQVFQLTFQSSFQRRDLDVPLVQSVRKKKKSRQRQLERHFWRLIK